jgi:hypothetical protein
MAPTASVHSPTDACIVDRIEQFEAELANPETAPEKRLVTLKFLLHLVGDVHQPLHAADDHDAGVSDRVNDLNRTMSG